MENKKPQFMMIYRCSECGMESGYTEQDEPVCRYCDEPTEMKLVSKEKITPEAIARRLGKLSENMFSNLQSAYEGMTEEDKELLSGDEDPEKLMLTLLARAKKFKEDIEKLDLKEPEE